MAIALGDPYHSAIIQHRPSSSPDLLQSFYKQSAIIQHTAAPSQSRFSYAVNDHLSGDIKSQEESRYGDGSVQGSYSLIDADGYRRIVHYTANPYSGFKAIVQREPVHSLLGTATASVIAPIAAMRNSASNYIPLHIGDSYTPWNYHQQQQQPTSYQTISLPTRSHSTNDYQSTFINHWPLIHHQQSF